MPTSLRRQGERLVHLLTVAEHMSEPIPLPLRVFRGGRSCALTRSRGQPPLDVGRQRSRGWAQVATRGWAGLYNARRTTHAPSVAKERPSVKRFLSAVVLALALL